MGLGLCDPVAVMWKVSLIALCISVCARVGETMEVSGRVRILSSLYARSRQRRTGRLREGNGTCTIGIGYLLWNAGGSSRSAGVLVITAGGVKALSSWAAYSWSIDPGARTQEFTFTCRQTCVIYTKKVTIQYESVKVNV